MTYFGFQLGTPDDPNRYPPGFVPGKDYASQLGSTFGLETGQAKPPSEGQIHAYRELARLFPALFGQRNPDISAQFGTQRYPEGFKPGSDYIGLLKSRQTPPDTKQLDALETLKHVYPANPPLSDRANLVIPGKGLVQQGFGKFRVSQPAPVARPRRARSGGAEDDELEELPRPSDQTLSLYGANFE